MQLPSVLFIIISNFVTNERWGSSPTINTNISMKILVSIAWASTLKTVFYSPKFICWYFPKQTCYTWDDKNKALIFFLVQVYTSTTELLFCRRTHSLKAEFKLKHYCPLKQVGNFRYASLSCIVQYKQILLVIYLKLYTDMLSTSEQKSGDWCLEEKAKNKALHKAGSKHGK